MEADRDVSPHNYFQIVIRLQRMRALVYQWLQPQSRQPRDPEIREILAAIEEMASIARGAGLTCFKSICFDVCERIELFLGGEMPEAMLEVIAEWAAIAELYLRRPRYSEFAKSLVLQLNDPRWGRRLGRTEQSTLIRALIQGSHKV